MRIFKEAFFKFKKNFLKLFLLDALFFILITLFFIFFRNKINDYIITSQYYASTLQNSNLSNIIEVGSNLDVLNSVVQRTYIYTFFIFPIVIFLIYVLFQGTSFYLLKKSFHVKKDLFIYLLRFLLVSILLSLVDFLLIRSILLNEFSLLLFIILILVGYFTVLSYYYLDSNLKRILDLKKVHVLFPLILLLFVFYFLSFFFVFLMFIEFNVLLLLGTLLLLFLLAYNKNLIFTYLHHS